MNDVKALEEKNRLYTYYLDAVKRDGIPYELISKALPVIENEVNNILAQVVDFGITMEMDGKSINAKIVYDDQEWGLEMCSGMEKFVSGLAIRVALINVCNLPRPNFLVIDEGFGTLDSDNLSSLFMMMQYLKTQFDFIWIISHLEQMRDIVDGLIEIKKVDGFSKIDF
jgi:exonuclease SbcC